MTSSVKHHLDSCYGAEPDVVTIRLRQSAETIILTSSSMTFQRRVVNPVGDGQDGKKTIKGIQALVSQAVTKKEFMETGQY